MGWSAGSSLGAELYIVVREHIPQEERKNIALQFYNTFCDYDADDWDGSSQLEIDAEVNQEEEDDADVSNE